MAALRLDYTITKVECNPLSENVASRTNCNISLWTQYVGKVINKRKIHVSWTTALETKYDETNTITHAHTYTHIQQNSKTKLS